MAEPKLLPKPDMCLKPALLSLNPMALTKSLKPKSKAPFFYPGSVGKSQFEAKEIRASAQVVGDTLWESLDSWVCCFVRGA